jgi:hypothetical protein
MLRHRALLLGALAALSIPALGMAPQYGTVPSRPTVVGPDQILYMDADTVFYIRSQAWWSANVNHQEKLLLRSLRMKYWSQNLPPDMRLVFETIGYPVGRVILDPEGHTDELWYYRQLDPPLRFRDGVLLNPDRFEVYRNQSETYFNRTKAYLDQYEGHITQP